MTDQQWQDQHLIFERAIRAMIGCPVPMIAAVNGAAYAGGMEMALCCDFIYAAEHARFALTEVTLGIMPGAGGTQNLPRAVGARRAKEILLTGTPFTAQQAFEWGMVNRICPADDAAGRDAGDRRAHRRQRADLDAADQAVGELRAEHGPRQRHDVRDRGLQPHGADRGPPRGHPVLQRKAQAGLQGTLSMSTTAKTDVMLREMGLRDGLQSLSTFMPTRPSAPRFPPRRRPGWRRSR